MPDERHLTPDGRGSGGGRPEWAKLAQRQYGVITRAQLRACGITDNSIDRWAKDGRLFRLYAGVYAAGHPVLVPDGRRLAAALACGPMARMALTDAGAIHNICVARGSRFAVVVPHGARRRGARTGIHIRESRLGPDDIAVVRGIPVTSLARTIVDIAGWRPDDAKPVIDTAITLGIYDQRTMDRQLRTGRRGVGIVRNALAARHPDAHRTKSDWEKEMLPLLDAHGISRPLVNQPIIALGLEPDLLWPRRRLVVEWDSWEHHRAREQFETDRDKTLKLQRAGYTVLRFTWRMTQDQPERVIADIRAALDQRAPPHPR